MPVIVNINLHERQPSVLSNSSRDPGHNIVVEDIG